MRGLQGRHLAKEPRVGSVIVSASLFRFDTELHSPSEEMEWRFNWVGLIPWSDFLLNPRRLRGSDFLMRWSQGRWSEDRLREAVARTGRFFAIPYGPSGTAPKDVKKLEEYFDSLEKAGLGTLKRPDLLVARAADKPRVRTLVEELGGVEKLPFTPEEAPKMAELIQLAVLAVECENSLWVAKRMPDFRKPLSPQRRLGGERGLKKNAVVPTIILKEEDREPLKKWQGTHGIPVHIWHVFYDLAYGLGLDEAERLISSGMVQGTLQVFQAPGGPTTRKTIYKIPYHHAYMVGKSLEQPRLVADKVIDKNGHILPYVRFKGGRLGLSRDCMKVLNQLAIPNVKATTHGE